MDQTYNLTDIFQLLWKDARRIFILALLIGIVTAIITLFMPNYYQAETVFYAASPDLSTPSPINNTNEKLEVYGNDYDIDRLLSISTSNELIQFLVSEFNLYDHYNIDSTDEKAKHKVRKRFLSLYDVIKTKYGAISLTIEDKDPEMAASIANNAREKISDIAQNLIKESQKKTLKSYQDNIEIKSKLLYSLNDSLRNQKETYGIIDLTSQAEVLAINSSEVNLSLDDHKGMFNKMKELNLPKDTIKKVQAKIAGLEKKKVQIDNQLRSFNQGAASVRTLEAQINLLNGQVGLLKERYNQLNASFVAPFTTLHTVEKADIPVVKSRPKRSLIVLGSFLFSIAVFAFILIIQHSLSPEKTTSS